MSGLQYEEEVKAPTLPQVSNSQTNTQTVGTAAAEEHRWQRYMQQWQQQQEQHMQMMQQQMSALTTLVTQGRPSTTAVSKAAATSAADTLPTPQSAVMQARRATARQVAYPPSTPSTPTSALPSRESEAELEASHAIAAPVKRGEGQRYSLREILQTIKGFVEPFYADSVKDKDTTVLDFVEKVESAMSDVVLDDQAYYRVAVVRMFLREGALRWMNQKLQDLATAGIHPVDWATDVRREFIEAHIGTDTVELWLAQLGTLRLGKGKTKTPIELNSQFDTIARHVYPTMSSGEKGVDLLLTTEYRNIIAASNKEMYATIVRTQPHSTLKEWKTAVANQWNAEAQIRAMMDNHIVPSQWRGGNWRGKGGRGGGARGSDSQPAVSAAAMDVSDGGGKEGEEYTDETEEGQQLTSVGQQLTAVGTSQRGGRGGRGGRGRCGGQAQQRIEYTEEQIKKLQEDKRCFRCGQTGHTARGCLNTRVDLSTPQQSKGKAGQ